MPVAAVVTIVVVVVVVVAIVVVVVVVAVAVAIAATVTIGVGTSPNERHCIVVLVLCCGVVGEKLRYMRTVARFRRTSMAPPLSCSNGLFVTTPAGAALWSWSWSSSSS